MSVQCPAPPRSPEGCRRHRWAQVIDLRTGEPTGRIACWHCGKDRSGTNR